MTQVLTNPFDIIDDRLSNIENILRDLKKISSEITSPKSDGEDIGDILLAARITGLAKPTLYALVSRDKIPFMKKGKRLYFSRSELTSWIKSGRSGGVNGNRDDSSVKTLTKQRRRK
jgi:excisionase family DNA binding protein